MLTDKPAPAKPRSHQGVPGTLGGPAPPPPPTQGSRNLWSLGGAAGPPEDPREPDLPKDVLGQAGPATSTGWPAPAELVIPVEPSSGARLIRMDGWMDGWMEGGMDGWMYSSVRPPPAARPGRAEGAEGTGGWSSFSTTVSIHHPVPSWRPDG
eukprot:gene7745-biopygen12083